MLISHCLMCQVALKLYGNECLQLRVNISLYSYLFVTRLFLPSHDTVCDDSLTVCLFLKEKYFLLLTAQISFKACSFVALKYVEL